VLVGNGMNTSFWRDIWVGNSSLCDSFPFLFSISKQKEACVRGMGDDGGVMTWSLTWPRTGSSLGGANNSTELGLPSLGAQNICFLNIMNFRNLYIQVMRRDFTYVQMALFLPSLS